MKMKYLNNFLLVCVFCPVESKSDVHFRRPEKENLDNQEKKNFGLSGVSKLCRRKWTLDLGATSQKKSLQSGKFALFRKFRVDTYNSECHAITVT